MATSVHPGHAGLSQSAIGTHLRSQVCSMAARLAPLAIGTTYATTLQYIPAARWE